MCAVFVELGTNLYAIHKGQQGVPVQLLQVGVGPGQRKELGIAVCHLLGRAGSVQFLQRRFQTGGLLLQVGHHTAQAVVVQLAHRVVGVQFGDDLVDGCDPGLRPLLFQLPSFEVLLAAHPPDRLLDQRLHFLIAESQETVQVLPYQLHQVGVADAYPLTGFGNVLALVGA